MSLNINPQKGNPMTQEEELFAEVDNILKDAEQQEAKRYVDYVKSVALQVEQTLHQEYGATEDYQLWTLSLEHKGTPESLLEFKEKAIREQPIAQSLTVEREDDEINACLGMEAAFVAQPGMPPDINGLLENRQAMFLVHAKRENLVGFVARTGAWGSNSCVETGKKPSESDDRRSMTMTIYYASGQIVVIPRVDETGELMEEAIQTHSVFIPCADVAEKYDGKSNAEVAELCADWLADNHGRTAALIYQAYALPKALSFDDNEMYQALIKDALLAAANEETEQE
jgi:hypothetical protein